MRTKLLLAFVSLVIGSSALAQTSNIGGSSARPKFQEVTIQSSATNFNPEKYCANGQGADLKCIGFRIGGGADFQINTLLDSGAAVGNPILQATRTAAGAQAVTIAGATSINLQSPSVLVNGSAILSGATGSATLTVVGCTTSPTISAPWARSGSLVIVSVAPVSCTSNSTAFRLTGLPAAILPTIGGGGIAVPGFTDNGTTVYPSPVMCYAVNNSSSAEIWCARNGNTAGFTGSGSKGIATGFNVVYSLNM